MSATPQAGADRVVADHALQVLGNHEQDPEQRERDGDGGGRAPGEPPVTEHGRVDEPVRGVFMDLDLWMTHFQQGAGRGVIHLRDVIYYVAVSYFFLLLAVKTLEAKRWQ